MHLGHREALESVELGRGEARERGSRRPGQNADPTFLLVGEPRVVCDIDALPWPLPPSVRDLPSEVGRGEPGQHIVRAHDARLPTQDILQRPAGVVRPRAHLDSVVAEPAFAAGSPAICGQKRPDLDACAVVGPP